MAIDTKSAETLIKLVPWTDDIDDKLAVSAKGDLEIIKHQVKTGVAQLWQCEHGQYGGYVVTRIDPGPELCLVLGEGSGFEIFAPHFLAVARRSGIPFRTHVTRKGLIRLWSRLGVTIDEYVLRG